MSAEIALVQAVQKYPCFYNTNLLEYNREDLREAAWSHGCIVSECKEKWRNIRCSLLRSLKLKFKDLTAYLQFQSINNLEIVEASSVNEAQKSGPSKDITISTVTSEPEDFEVQSDQGSVIMEIPVPIVEAVIADSIMSRQQSPELRKYRDLTPIISKTLERKLKRLKYRQGYVLNIAYADSSRRNNNGIRYFLLSLLPEFETMSEEQIRLFKIKIMLLKDKHKTNDTDKTEQ